jgi:hypothetical protein
MRASITAVKCTTRLHPRAPGTEARLGGPVVRGLSICALLVRRSDVETKASVGATPIVRAREQVMAKFVYAYSGGQMAETPEAQEQAMQAWGAWFGTLGDNVVDMGNPFGASSTVKSGGSASGGISGLGGYSVVQAGSLEEAAANAAGCPVLATGGSVEVYQALEM